MNVSLSPSAILELSGRPERPSVTAQPRITPQVLNHYTTQIFTDHGRLTYTSGSGSPMIFICSIPWTGSLRVECSTEQCQRWDTICSAAFNAFGADVLGAASCPGFPRSSPAFPRSSLVCSGSGHGLRFYKALQSTLRCSGLLFKQECLAAWPTRRLPSTASSMLTRFWWTRPVALSVSRYRVTIPMTP